MSRRIVRISKIRNEPIFSEESSSDEDNDGADRARNVRQIRRRRSVSVANVADLTSPQQNHNTDGARSVNHIQIRRRRAISLANVTNSTSPQHFRNGGVARNVQQRRERLSVSTSDVIELTSPHQPHDDVGARDLQQIRARSSVSTSDVIDLTSPHQSPRPTEDSPVYQSATAGTSNCRDFPCSPHAQCNSPYCYKRCSKMTPLYSVNKPGSSLSSIEPTAFPHPELSSTSINPVASYTGHHSESILLPPVSENYSSPPSNPHLSRLPFSCSSPRFTITPPSSISPNQSTSTREINGEEPIIISSSDDDSTPSTAHSNIIVPSAQLLPSSLPLLHPLTPLIIHQHPPRQEFVPNFQIPTPYFYDPTMRAIQPYHPMNPYMIGFQNPTPIHTPFYAPNLRTHRRPYRPIYPYMTNDENPNPISAPFYDPNTFSLLQPTRRHYSANGPNMPGFPNPTTTSVTFNNEAQNPNWTLARPCRHVGSSVHSHQNPTTTPALIYDPTISSTTRTTFSPVPNNQNATPTSTPDNNLNVPHPMPQPPRIQRPIPPPTPDHDYHVITLNPLPPNDVNDNRQPTLAMYIYDPNQNDQLVLTSALYYYK